MIRRPKFPARFRPKPQPTDDRTRLQRYHAAKDHWLAFHPTATAAEIEAAFLAIARRHGI